MRALLVAVFVLVGVPALWSQGGQAPPPPQKEKEKPEAKAPRKPARSYTDEDLKRARESGRGNVVFLPSLPPDADASASSSSSEGDGDKQGELDAEGWRQAAEGHRQAVSAGEDSVRALEERIAELTNDMSPNPSDLFDPNRLQKREAEKQKLIPQLEKAREDLAAARKGLADLEQEARQKNIPPGWLQP